MSIDPKTSAILNLLVTVLGAVVGATAEWTTLLGQGTAQNVLAIMGLALTVLGALNTGLHSVSSAKAGPLVS